MKIGVVGGRDFKDYDLLKKTIDDFINKIIIPEEIIIVSGAALGADSLAEFYVDQIPEYDKLIFPPEKKKYGIPRAFFERNTQIVDASDVLIAFWNGKSTGTKDSVTKARKKGIPIYIIAY